MHEIIVRKMGRNDSDGVMALLGKHAEYHALLLPHYFKAGQSKSKWREYIDKNKGESDVEIFVAVHGSTIIGIVSGRIERQNSPIIRPRSIGKVTRAFVLKEYRRAGVLRKMMHSLLNWFKQKKIHIVLVNSVANNKIGTKAWEGLGFEVQSHRLELRA